MIHKSKLHLNGEQLLIGFGIVVGIGLALGWLLYRICDWLAGVL